MASGVVVTIGNVTAGFVIVGIVTTSGGEVGVGAAGVTGDTGTVTGASVELITTIGGRLGFVGVGVVITGIVTVIGGAVTGGSVGVTTGGLAVGIVGGGDGGAGGAGGAGTPGSMGFMLTKKASS